MFYGRDEPRMSPSREQAPRFPWIVDAGRQDDSDQDNPSGWGEPAEDAPAP